MRKERFEAISDAVLAIIATLMVLEIKVGDLTDASLKQFVFQLLVYAVSFAYIAILWINHHNMLRHVEKIDMKIVWVNFWLLFFTSLIPLATSTINEEFYNTRSHLFFGSVLTVVVLFYSILEELVYKITKHKYNESNRKMNWLSMCVFALSIPLSYVSIYISSAIFILIPFSYFILPKKANQHFSNLPGNLNR
ncbi:MAG TPA: TMEM175 family protein [Chitinophagales bacterium]|nr:TMEM175 family protein [Chitinophagales bacterium]